MDLSLKVSGHYAGANVRHLNTTERNAVEFEKRVAWRVVLGPPRFYFKAPVLFPLARQTDVGKILQHANF